MIREWMIAGLMGATVLSGIAPATAMAQQERSNPRWGDRRGNEGGLGERQYGGRRQASENTPAAPPQRVQQQVAPRTNAAETQPPRTERRTDWRAVREDKRQDNRDSRRDWRQDNRDGRREWRQDDRNDRRDWRRDNRDDRRDWRNDRRDDRRDWRDNRRNDWSNNRYEWNRDWRNDRRYDWQRYRQTHRHVYRGPRYYVPRGWDYGYRRFSIGISLWSGLYTDRYWISDPWYYRLPPAYGSLRWVRYYDDALLVDIRTGYVVDVIYDFFW